MLCEKCQKNAATVRYAEVVDGKSREMRLCAACMAKQQEVLAAGFEFTTPGPVNRPASIPRPRPAPREPEEVCSNCGQRLSRVRASQQMGCMMCYETFSEHVETLLKEIHPGLRHRGKVPHVDDARARIRTDLQTKRALLRSALDTENYEEAAHLRDEIRVLEQELVSIDVPG